MILPFRTPADIDAAIPQVAAHLAADRLLGYPTETVYGLGSSPTVPALRLLARLKGRELGKPFLLLVSGRVMAEAWGLPLTSPPATRPGGPPAPGPDRLVELFQDSVDAGDLLVLDGGVLGNVPPSTLVDCTDSVPRMVREGALPRAELRRAAGRLAP